MTPRRLLAPSNAEVFAGENVVRRVWSSTGTSLGSAIESCSVCVMSTWRHARAIALLPGTAAVLVPTLILVGEGASIGWGLDGGLAAGPVLAGFILIGAGFALWVWTMRLFAEIGKGTLAPWDPTRRLVVDGPYSHVRNPMITAVVAVLIGEAALFGSAGMLIWCAVFFAINWVYFRAARGARSHAPVRGAVPHVPTQCAPLGSAAHALDPGRLARPRAKQS
jgi:protein-S-isoprenylcysteine O-methyltransferase Ste14